MLYAPHKPTTFFTPRRPKPALESILQNYLYKKSAPLKIRQLSQTVKDVRDDRGKEVIHNIYMMRSVIRRN